MSCKPAGPSLVSSPQSPLVSTIIPTFNRRHIVARAIESALAQTYKDQEIIVVDDGSTDGTAEFLQATYGSKIRVFSQENAGVSAARNAGMRASMGSLIALLDSDDEWEPTKLEKQVAFLRDHADFGMVLTDVRRVDGAGQTIDIFRRRDVITQDGDVFADILLNPSLVPASAVFRREVFEQTRGFDESLNTAEDIDFHLRVAASFNIGLLEESLTIAARSGDGLSSVASSDSDYVQVVERVICEHLPRISQKVRNNALFRTYLRNSRSSFLSRRLGEGGRYLWKAACRVRTVSNVADLGRIAMTGLRALAVVAKRRLTARDG